MTAFVVLALTALAKICSLFSPALNMSTTDKLKRRTTTSKLTPEELTRKILFFAVENLIPFEKIQNPFFKNLLSFDSSMFLLDSELMLYLVNEIYIDYVDYFKAYIERNNFKLALTCHIWSPPNEVNPYVFVNSHYIDAHFKICEVPLGLFEYTSTNMANFLISNKLIKNKLNFITSNFKFDENCKDVLRFLNEGESIQDKILICIPQLINDFVFNFLEDLAEVFSMTIQNTHSLKHLTNSSHVIPSAVQMFLGPIYDKCAGLNLSDILPDPMDKDNHFDNLTKPWLRNRKSCSLDYLEGIAYYKKQLDDKTINEFEWDLISFVVRFVRRFYQVLTICNTSQTLPSIHMVLKWLKVLILHVNEFKKSHSMFHTYNLDPPLKRILERLTVAHNDIEKKFDITLSSYLHPSTKRYLKEEHINKINTYVGSIGKTANLGSIINPYAITPVDTETSFISDNLDDMIMQMFDCSGKATKECYNYETSATNEVKYSKSTDYVSREGGQYILQFWNRNSKKYSNLCMLAKQTLCIQTSTDRNLQGFKASFDELQRSITFGTHCPCHIQALYFLHCLSKVYDLNNFDPKDLESDIDENRIEVEYTGDGSSFGSSKANNSFTEAKRFRRE